MFQRKYKAHLLFRQSECHSLGSIQCAEHTDASISSTSSGSHVQRHEMILAGLCRPETMVLRQGHHSLLPSSGLGNDQRVEDGLVEFLVNRLRRRLGEGWEVPQVMYCETAAQD